jgi:lysozyme
MTHVTSESGIDFIIRHECPVGNINSCLKAYQDAAGVWTIGVGSTHYLDGHPVHKDDRCTSEFAMYLFKGTLAKIYEPAVNHAVTSLINQNQFDALVSLTYNIGITAFQRSTLVRMVNADPTDPEIRGQFLKWDRAGGRELPGLMHRRKDEADLYFS